MRVRSKPCKTPLKWENAQTVCSVREKSSFPVVPTLGEVPSFLISQAITLKVLTICRCAIAYYFRISFLQPPSAMTSSGPEDLIGRDGTPQQGG